MPDFSPVFSTSDFIPHGHCYLWQPTLVWLHLVSDSLIALAYYSIPVSLVYLAKQRQDLPFKWVFWLFGAFIVACGTTHLLDVWTLWYPTYWVSGALKALTALLSIATAGTLWQLLPRALQLPSPNQLAAANVRLQVEIEEHKATEAALRERKARLRDAQKLARLGHWELDLVTQTRTWSEELYALFGLEPQAPLPDLETMWQRFTDHSREQLRHAMQRATTDGVGFELEVQYTLNDGNLGWFLSQGRALRDAAGVITKLVGNLQEITDRKQAALETQRLQERLSLALQSGAIGMWDWDVTENILTWDDRMYELYGITPAAFTSVYEAWANSVHPDDRPFAEAAIQQALTGEKDYAPTFRVIHPDGTIRFIKAYALVERNEQGELKQMVGINYDITERKEAEQQLELQSTITRNMAEGVCLVRVADGIIVYANPKFERMFGYEPGLLVGQHVSVVNYEDRQASDQAVYESLAQTIREQGEATYEIQNVKHDGTPFWGRATTSVLDHPTYGTVFVAVQQDITERKHVEEQLQASLQAAEESKKILDALMEYIPEGITIADAPDVLIRWVSRYGEQLTGQNREVLEGISVEDHAETWQILCADGITPATNAALPLTRAVQQGEVVTNEEWVLCQPNGRKLTIACNAGPIRDQQGNITGGVIAWRDITERKQTEDTIRASLKEKEVLLQEIHHRVKNNLQIVYSLLRLQRRALKDPEAAAVLLESQNRVEAIALVHEKLYQAGDLAHIDASEYIPNLVVNLVSTYGLHAHQVQLELAIEPLPLSMDCAVPCGLMINELVSNAFKYAFPDQRPGQLTVSLSADSTDTQTPHITLTVADNGVGLPAHVSLSDATTLGLQLVSDFVAQLHGTLQLDSTHGTSVQVRFPQHTLRQTPVPC